MRHIFGALLALAMFMASPAQAQQITCQQSVTVTPTTATDTLLVAAVNGTNIYVCDYEFSSNGTNNFYLEKAVGATCSGSKTQISNTWYTIVNLAKTAANAIYRGMNTGGGASLCVNTSASQTISITVYYSQQ